jgi:anaerobic dimethyl sulfoxide reductase subunit A
VKTVSDSILPPKLTRRKFLKTSAATAAVVAVSDKLLGGPFTTLVARPAVAEAQAAEAKVYKGVCPGKGICGTTCPLKVTVEDGRITHITNPPDFTCCVKGHAMRMQVYNPTRLKYPMKRVGERGEGKFERITWEEAVDTYASKIREIESKYGRETILWYPGRGLSGLATAAPQARFANMLGGFLTKWGSLCIANKGAAANTVYGTGKESDLDTIKDSNLAIIWGYGFADSNRRGDFAGTAMRTIMDAKESGTRIVGIDPFLSQTAARADQWIPIKPGTDGAMALAMANVIINQDLYDKEFIALHVLGFDEFKEHVQQYTPEWAAEITGVPAEVITDLAVEFATQQPAALYIGDGPSRVGRDPSQWVRACGALTAIVGSVGKPGTNATHGSAFVKGFTTGDLAAGDMNEVKLKVNECQIADAILTGKAVQASGEVVDCPIHMIIHHGGNFLNQSGDINKTVRALKSPGLEFMIVADLFLTPTAKFADLLLPATTSFEGNDCAYPNSYNHGIVYGEKAIEPMYECRSDADMFAAVADRLGIGAEYHSDWTDLDWMRETLKISREKSPQLADVSLERLQEEHVIFLGPRPYIGYQEQVTEGKPFPTESGKIEIYSKDQEEKGLPALPTYLDDFENERHPLADKYPLTICTPHSIASTHSRYFTNPWMQEVYPVEVFINPIDAAARGIRDGDTVIVFNDRGSTQRSAKVSERIMAGVLALPQGPWFDPGPDGLDRGGAHNVLSNDEIDNLGGSGTYNSVLVEIKKA